MIGYDDNEPAHELQYIYTTEKKARSETFNDCDTSLMLHDGDKVMTGTPVYVVNAHRIHLMSDAYIVDEIMLELQQKQE